jgi:hypothetical protein
VASQQALVILDMNKRQPDGCTYWKTEESSEVVSDVTDHRESSQRQAASMIRICGYKLVADMPLCPVAVSIVFFLRTLLFRLWLPNSTSLVGDEL